jgi:formylglycine-generating enzyme required for sulfatase activity
VSWYDAIRFANWLNNGQGTGSTEVGAYTLKTGVFTINSINRNPGAIWFLPNEDEWYKAAYYQPAAKGGDADDYWLYPTASNSAPTLAQAVDAAGPTRGDIANPGVNIANYLLTADWNGQNGNITTAGSAGSSSQSFYGTSDQAGNVHEWNETRIDSFFRGVRGGGWNSFAYFGESTYRWHGTPTGGSSTVGFRVATILVPEPSTLLLAASGLTALVGVAVARHRRR